MRIGRLAMMAAATMSLGVGLLAPAEQQVVLERPRSRPTRRARVQQRRELAAPNLNRAKRHPFAESYGDAANISTALGLRDHPLR